jgi:flagellar protein FliO/FliZ
MNAIFASGLESFFRLVVAILMFLFVLAACYFTTVWLGNFQKGKMGKGNIEVIEIHKLSNNKYLEITRIGKKYYILAVSKDRIDKIDVIDECDIELPDTSSRGVPESFQQILEKVKKMKHQQDKEQVRENEKKNL